MTRARMLLAVRRIILRQGLHALSIRKLAAQVRHAPGTMDFHFNNREAIARSTVI